MLDCEKLGRPRNSVVIHCPLCQGRRECGPPGRREGSAEKAISGGSGGAGSDDRGGIGASQFWWRNRWTTTQFPRVGHFLSTPVPAFPATAVISLGFSSVLTCPKVSMLPFDKLGRSPGADQVGRLLHRLAGHEGRHRPGPAGKTRRQECRGRECREVGPGKVRNHSSLPSPDISTWTQESAPQSTAQMTTAAMSGNRRRLLRSIRGSAKSRKRSMAGAPCPFTITPPLNPAHSSTSLSLRRDCPANPGNRARFGRCRWWPVGREIPALPWTRGQPGQLCGLR